MHKIGIFTDLHLGIKKDDLKRVSVAEETVDYVIKTCKENNVEHVYFMGDWWHSRTKIGVTTLDRGQDIVKRLYESFNTTFILGNHDIHYKNNTDVHSLKFLKLGHDSRINLVESIQDTEIFGKKILLIPWLPRSLDCHDAFKEAVEKLNHNSYDLILGHLDLDITFFIQDYMQDKIKKNSKVDSSQVYSYLNEMGFIDENKSFLDYDKIKQQLEHVEEQKPYLSHFMNLCRPNGLVLSGHYHKHIEYNLDDNKKFIFVGAPLEMTWADMDNPKGFYILDLAKDSTTFFENPKGPKHKYFYYSQIKENPKLINPETVTPKTIAKLIVDCEYEVIDVYKVVQSINALTPFEDLTADNIEYLFSKSNGVEDLTSSSPNINFKMSKLNSIIDFINKIDGKILEERKLDRNKLIQLAASYYNRYTESTNE